MTHTKRMTIKEKVVTMRGTEVNGSMEGSMEEVSRKISSARWDFPQLITERHIGWIERKKESDPGMLCHGPQLVPPSQSFTHTPHYCSCHIQSCSILHLSREQEHLWGTSVDTRQTAEVGWNCLPTNLHTGIWTVPHCLYPSEMVPFHCWWWGIEHCYSEWVKEPASLAC